MMPILGRHCFRALTIDVLEAGTEEVEKLRTHEGKKERERNKKKKFLACHMQWRKLQPRGSRC